MELVVLENSNLKAVNTVAKPYAVIARIRTDLVSELDRGDIRFNFCKVFGI